MKLVPWSLVLTASSAGVLALLNTPAVRLYLAPTANSSDNRCDAASDPKKGVRFPVPPSDAFGKPIRPTRETIVVIAGSCSSCSLDSIDRRQVLPEQGQTVVFAYQMTAKDLPSWTHGLGGSVRVVADGEELLCTKANAIWKPRYVRLDSSHRVVELSDDLSGMPTYIHLRS